MPSSDSIDAPQPIPRKFDNDALDEAVELRNLLRQLDPQIDDLIAGFVIGRSFSWDPVKTAALLLHLSMVGEG